MTLTELLLWLVTQLEEKYPWLYSAPGEIRLGDIPSLLAEYKRMAHGEIQRQLQATRR